MSAANQTCKDCAHFQPRRDPDTKRCHPSKPGDCSWRPEPIAWSLAYLIGFRGKLIPVPHRSAVWRYTDARDCKQFKPLVATKPTTAEQQQLL